MTLTPVGANAAPRPAAVAQASAPIRFDFHNHFLLNLHHWLFVLSRRADLSFDQHMARTPWLAAPNETELQALSEAAAFYRGNYAALDFPFDEGLERLRHALIAAPDDQQASLGLALPPALAAQLDRVAPLYARGLWPVHRHSNARWIRVAEALNARHGASIQARLEQLFGQRFAMQRFRDDVVYATSDIRGAYTPDGPPQSVLPSHREEYQGLAALEMLYHEASHTGPVEALFTQVNTKRQALGRGADRPALWHALQFYTVGEVVRQRLREHDGVDYQPYALKNGVYGRGWAKMLAPMQRHWQAYIDGQLSLDQALDRLLVELPD
ncbi:hypothetical protein RQP53_15410 [Paucibacter sp. APW11]|uniref:DUF2268 domain-containing protein n=1 Tax=Roseateles aquae TaxID=3077235 RepID=A0ABU3PDM0_9BURK|nr:hypothetical protein [Paucibacter sp. APW11]MDT9000662.1 hypothetical protein [Paucibacter sp. APW11]